MLLEVAEMMQRSETKDLELERLPLVKDESIQLKEGIVSNLIMIYVVVVGKLSLSLYV